MRFDAVLEMAALMQSSSGMLPPHCSFRSSSVKESCRALAAPEYQSRGRCALRIHIHEV